MLVTRPLEPIQHHLSYEPHSSINKAGTPSAHQQPSSAQPGKDSTILDCQGSWHHCLQTDLALGNEATSLRLNRAGQQHLQVVGSSCTTVWCRPGQVYPIRPVNPSNRMDTAQQRTAQSSSCLHQLHLIEERGKC